MQKLIDEHRYCVVNLDPDGKTTWFHTLEEALQYYLTFTRLGSDLAICKSVSLALEARTIDESTSITIQG